MMFLHFRVHAQSRKCQLICFLHYSFSGNPVALIVGVVKSTFSCNFHCIADQTSTRWRTRKVAPNLFNTVDVDTSERLIRSVDDGKMLWRNIFNEVVYVVTCLLYLT